MKKPKKHNSKSNRVGNASKKSSKKIKFTSYLPGKGKTEEAINNIVKNFINNSVYTSIYVVPSIELSRQIVQRLVEIGILIDFIHEINSETDSKLSVKKQIVEHRKKYGTPGYLKSILIITHASFMNLDNQNIPENDVYIDEAINLMKETIIDSSSSIVRSIILDYLKIRDYDKNYYELYLDKNTFTNQEFDNLIYTHEMIKAAESKDCFSLIRKEDYDSFKNNKNFKCSVFSVKDINFIGDTNLHTLGFDIQNSEMALVLKTFFGHSFDEIKSNDTSKYSYSNDIFVHYLSDEDIGNSKLRGNILLQNEIINTLKDLELDSHNLTDFNTIGLQANTSEFEVSACSHGINKPEWMDNDITVILSNYRMNRSTSRFYQDFGYSIKELDRARDISIKAQIFTRSSIRTDSTEDVHLYVLDLRTAEGIKEIFENSNVIIKKIDSKVEKMIEKKKNTITREERTRMDTLRRKKRKDITKFSSKEEKELMSLVLKMKDKSLPRVFGGKVERI